MSAQHDVIGFEGDESAIEELRAILENESANIDVQSRRSQIGDPETWFMIAELVIGGTAAIAALIAAIGPLLKSQKIKYVIINGEEFRNTTVDDIASISKKIEGMSTEASKADE